MTDNEIIKALECCLDTSPLTCKNCPLFNVTNSTMVCSKIVTKFALDLINRQQKEIVRLEYENEILSKNADTAFQDGLNEAQDLYAEQVKAEIKSEAIKEFAERLKKELGFGHYIQPDQIDNLVKEMVGDTK